jgi:hypothetical protein
MSKKKIIWYIEYMEANRTEEYLASDEYKVHLNYLIETWVSNVKDELGYNDEILDDPMLDPKLNMSLINVTGFNYEWLIDIFERKILDTNVCLK